MTIDQERRLLARLDEIFTAFISAWNLVERLRNGNG
jgi:hypothetical protein